MQIEPDPKSLRLSIIVPARNEALRLPSSLKKIAAYLTRTGLAAEVIVVDNGSSDATTAVVNQFAREHEWLQIKLLIELRQGKGAAVRTGMLQAAGEILFLCDADLSMPIEELEKFLTQLSERGDIAIGCREGAGAQRRGEPFHRQLMGRLFNWLVKTLGLTEFPDTQCGFKAFRRSVAQDLFAAQKVCGWGFDVEILSIARLRGYLVESIPIKWIHDSDSRVRPFQDALTMICDVCGIHRRLRMGFYGPCVRTQKTTHLPFSSTTFTSWKKIHKRAA